MGGLRKKVLNYPLGQCAAKTLGLRLPEVLRVEREPVAATTQKGSRGGGEF
jgi:hypothetical protein